MSNSKSHHPVNHDAIAQGASAFILNWPSEVERPPAIPRYAHQILWADDYWRGVDMAREVVDELVAGWKRLRTEEIRNPGEAQRASARLDAAVRATMVMVVSRMTHGQVLESDDADLDLADVIEQALRNLCTTGDPDRCDEHAWNCDHEVERDADEAA